MIRSLRLHLAATSIAVTALLSAAPRAGALDAGDAVELRFKFAAGDRWAFDEDVLIELKFNVSAHGKVVQALDRTTRKVRRGVLKMSYGEIPLRSNPERADGSGLILTTSNTDHKFVRLPSSVDGARFDGTWIFKDQYSDGRPDPSITFTPTGEFRDQGAVNVLHHGYPLVEPPGAGTYEVRNFTLTLRFSDGRRYRLAFPGQEWVMGNVRPSRLILSFNEDVLVRQ